MTDTENAPPDLMDMLVANGFMLEVFMLQTALEMAKNQPDPEAWSRHFISTMHSRIDSNEARLDDRRYPAHELARAGFDRLGTHLSVLLSNSKKSG